MDRDDEIRYLEDKITELRRDLTAAIDRQRSPNTAVVFQDYVAEIRRIDRLYETYSTRLGQLTGKPQPKQITHPLH